MSDDDDDRAAPVGPGDPAAVTEEREYEEPPLNHLSPMGQVEAIGRLARGVGGNRLRRWIQIVIPVLMAALLAAIVIR